MFMVKSLAAGEQSVSFKYVITSLSLWICRLGCDDGKMKRREGGGLIKVMLMLRWKMWFLFY